jgi:hypothetical protein
MNSVYQVIIFGMLFSSSSYAMDKNSPHRKTKLEALFEKEMVNQAASDSNLKGEFRSSENKNRGTTDKETSRGSLNINLEDVGSLAPVAIVMYCFKEHPKFTMMTLAGMLLVVILQSDKTQKKVARLQSLLFGKWHAFKHQLLYLWSSNYL